MWIGISTSATSTFKASDIGSARRCRRWRESTKEHAVRLGQSQTHGTGSLGGAWGCQSGATREGAGSARLTSQEETTMSSSGPEKLADVAENVSPKRVSRRAASATRKNPRPTTLTMSGNVRDDEGALRASGKGRGETSIHLVLHMCVASTTHGLVSVLVTSC